MNCLPVQLIYDNMGMDKPASRPYIAARFEAQALPPQFYLGNGQEYGAFVNRPLDKDDKYRVFLRAYSVDPVSVSFVATMLAVETLC